MRITIEVSEIEPDYDWRSDDRPGWKGSGQEPPMSRLDILRGEIASAINQLSQIFPIYVSTAGLVHVETDADIARELAYREQAIACIRDAWQHTSLEDVVKTAVALEVAASQPHAVRPDDEPF